MIRTWCDGYSWLGTERLYNPFDVLLFLRNRTFKPYWFQTGSPRFLFETLKRKSVSPLDLEGMLADESLVSKFEVEDVSAEALLFQTGYLTITDEIRRGHRTLYRLDCPNQEVRLSLNRGLLRYLGKTVTEVAEQGRDLRSSLEATTLSALPPHSRPGWPAFPTSGTRQGIWAATRPGTRASCTWPSGPSGWTCAPRQPPATGGPTWWCRSGRRCSSSSSGWRTVRMMPRLRSRPPSPDAGTGLCRHPSRPDRPSRRHRLRARRAQPAGGPGGAGRHLLMGRAGPIGPGAQRLRHRRWAHSPVTPVPLQQGTRTTSGATDASASPPPATAPTPLPLPPRPSR